jgi:AAA domain/UvrD-like helicase C-terminal domain
MDLSFLRPLAVKPAPMRLDISSLFCEAVKTPIAEAIDPTLKQWPVGRLDEVVKWLPLDRQPELMSYLQAPGLLDRVGPLGDTLDPKQWAAIACLALGIPVNIMGSAGTGKTTCTRVGLAEYAYLAKLDRSDRYSVACAFTRQATGVLRSKLQRGLACMTIHKLLDFAPMRVTKYDAEGNERTVRQFMPRMNADNPLSEDIGLIVIDEASMQGDSLFRMLIEAIDHYCSISMVGDTAQLPPVQDKSSMMLRLARRDSWTIELTKIFRTQEGNPVLDLAHMVRQGQVTELTDAKLLALSASNGPDGLPIRDKLDFRLNVLGDGTTHKTMQGALHSTLLFLQSMLSNGTLDMERGDMVLCPQNENFGVKDINLAIAAWYDKRDNRKVYEVRAGYVKHYVAVGDKIRVNNEPCFITKIEPNPKYFGVAVQLASVHLDRHGQYIDSNGQVMLADGESDFDIPVDLPEGGVPLGQAATLNSKLEQFLAAPVDDVAKKNAASHAIHYRHVGDKVGLDEDYIDSASEFNAEKAGLLNFAQTVHKSQGSEGHHVVLALHTSHGPYLRREMLYTAITRARVKLTVLSSPGMILKGSMSAAFPGQDWEQKSKAYVDKLGIDIAEGEFDLAN